MIVTFPFEREREKESIRTIHNTPNRILKRIKSSKIKFYCAFVTMMLIYEGKYAIKGIVFLLIKNFSLKFKNEIVSMQLSLCFIY